MGAAAKIARAEDRHTRRLSEIAEAIVEANAGRSLKTVLVSGPSSSGKTTFTGRLCSVLADKGLSPVPLSIDDFFVNREDTPRDADGQYDFEALEAVDLPLLNTTLQQLTHGGEVRLPIYDFVSGTRKWQESPLRLDDNSVIVMEGLHALNPQLTDLIPEHGKFKIFISCLTAAEAGRGARISTFDVRLVRRIARDNAHRGRTAEQTLEQWASVRRGEEKYVFPFLGDADTVFDSSLSYELSALRPLAEPLLASVGEGSAERSAADRLTEIVRRFEPIPSDMVPDYSLLREFVGL